VPCLENNKSEYQVVVLTQALMPVVRNNNYHFEYTYPAHGKKEKHVFSGIIIMAERDTDVFDVMLYML